MFIPAMALVASWWAYTRGMIEYRDLRVWLACHELVARRCGSEKGRVARFTLGELRSLVGGVGGQHARASLRRLEAVGLLSWSESSIGFIRSISDLLVPSLSDLESVLASVINNRRKVPVPRRLLRYLCAAGRPAVVGTAIGHLLRCMYYRAGECKARGLCKASWIAETLNLDERTVKAARSTLIRHGVIVREATPQRVMNRWGVAVRFNLEWSQVGQGFVPGSPPLGGISTTETPPPKRTGNSLPRSENQKPGVPVRSGACGRRGKAPRLSAVVPEDLRSLSRLETLRWEAVGKGILGPSEADRLRFMAAALHARRVADRNESGLFVAVVRGKLWHVISHADEEAARVRLGRESDRVSRPVSSRVGHAATSRPTSRPESIELVLHGVLSAIPGRQVRNPAGCSLTGKPAKACQSLADMVLFRNG